MKQENLRNIAIIAHVDHGKTTLVDRLLYTSGVFRENQQVDERVLDSNDQERERGITILSKNISVTYNGVKINVIDTPGHADFGGEVERVLNMADGALLIVDAFEGPMPQTRFVLKHALSLGLRIVLVVNKIDRPGARPEEVVDEVFDLMVELEASDEQLDFPIIYASAVNGYARFAPDDDNMDMLPLLETILKEIPAPDCEPNGPVALQICTVDHSSFVGRIGVGRLFSGTIHKNEQALVIKNDNTRYNTVIKDVFTFEELGKKKQQEVHAGDIVAVVGVEDADIGDMVTSRENPVRLDPIEVEEPTMAVVFEASTSPLIGREGDIVGARQLKERLMREAEKFGRPILCLVDTQGAFCGTEAEERGQGNAIADNLVAMAGLKVPVVTVLLGEGGSGGALALAVANRVAMQEHAVYSVLSPEGFASILWKDRTRAPEAAAVMKMSAHESLELGVIDAVVPEGPAPAHENPLIAERNVRDYVQAALDELCGMSEQVLLSQRYDRFRKF